MVLRKQPVAAITRPALAAALVGLVVAGCAPGFVVVPLGGSPGPEPAIWLETGQRVRVMAPSAGIVLQTATVVGQARDSLVLRGLRWQPGDAGPVLDSTRHALLLRSLGSLEISRGIRPDPGKGALWGLAIGVVGGGVWGSLQDCTGSFMGGSWGSGNESCTAYGAIGGALVGAAAGAIVGQLLLHSEHWERVPVEHLERVRVGIIPRAGGRLGFAASVAF